MADPRLCRNQKAGRRFHSDLRVCIDRARVARYDYSKEVTADASGSIWVAAGLWATWETARTYYLDSVTVTIDLVSAWPCNFSIGPPASQSFDASGGQGAAWVTAPSSSRRAEGHRDPARSALLPLTAPI